MLKHEVKIEFDNSEVLESIIQNTYFNGSNGKISGKENKLTITDEYSDVYEVLKELNNATVKISNQSIIEGTMRFIVEKLESSVELTPISTYCIKEDRYIFY